MKFSLVMATMGRERELHAFITSLGAQGAVDLELIVVDQNSDERVSRVLARAPGAVSVKHLRCPPGLSRARNRGMRASTGEIVAFPDDDCEYPAGLLTRVRQYFLDHVDCDGLAVRVASRDGKPIGRLLPHAGEVTPRSVWRQATAAGLFFRRTVISAVGDFDESLGLGSGTPWGAAEDIDYPLRALELGCRLRYEPSEVVWHPDVRLVRQKNLVRRGFSYGAGWGRVRRKHGTPLWVVAYNLVRPAIGVMLSLFSCDLRTARFRVAVVAGRLRGWLA